MATISWGKCPMGCCYFHAYWDHPNPEDPYLGETVRYCPQGGQRLNDDGTTTEMVPKEGCTDGDE